ncbi:uncharacterized protein LOC141641779 [Silene latifolia]|uniref:uncharacterized protein LOC141641779 n=1 Tax=Silene latifolia TaxID=37657 RepID=UPI003D76D103
MGQCASCTSSSMYTAKLISEDGKLEEFTYPVNVAYLLSTHPNTFICNSEDMEFDGVLTAVKDQENLQLGQLYFALPLSKLRRPLLAEEMAALAVKANAALLQAGVGENKCRRRRKTGFFGGEKSCSKVADVGSATVKSMNKGKGDVSVNGNNGRRMFLVNLSVIPE